MTMTDRKVTTSAAGKRMTLGELRDFIGALDEAGGADSTPVAGRVSFGGWLTQVKATAIRIGDASER